MNVIRGSTFAHRDFLKSIGARWDGDAKCWTHRNLSDVDRTAVAALGMIVSGGRAPPMPGTGPQPPMPSAATPEPVPSRRQARQPLPPGAKPEHGNDMTFRGHFASKDTLAFFGFATLDDHVNFVRNLPRNIQFEFADERNVGWVSSQSFAGTATMRDALALANDGWTEGADKAAEVLEILTAQHAQRRQRRHAMAGSSVNVGRMLAGNPLHMRHRPKRDGRVVKTLFVDASCSSGITADNMIVRAAIVASLADMLEACGYSCEIVVVSTPDDKSGKRSSYHIATRIKSAGDKLNLSDVVFALGHPSYLRRLIFATVAVEENCRKIWSFMGLPAPLFDADCPPGPNELFIDKLALSDQKKVTGKTLIERATTMLPLIIPKNFPIQLENDRC